ncbi:glycoside hydrolase family 10 protein [Anaeromicropila populeti]|uniref:Glycosyl hydrolase-like 10 n=1 Tax=Anaeromicropila populeti TaxID=37658 RepID=A0A1I6L1H7_9FIRM|nr:family 10 glycosylhydrolase [Anaeromicropila populeti]SFR97292.1 Glycosyl hydrolase-like 10 [Anaeromicropila populeti]
MIKRKITFYWILLFAGILFSFNTTASVSRAAAKDTKKPTVTVASSTKDYVNKNIKVTVTAKDASGIKLVKWASGSKTASYFKSKGTKLSLTKSKTSVTICKNGTYSFYVKDKAGNISVKKIVIKNIDKTTPIMEPEYQVNNQIAVVSLNASDSVSGIGNALYIKGTVSDTDSEKWSEKGTSISDLSTFQVYEPGNYSILLADEAGNKVIETVNVKLEINAVWISYLEFASAKISSMSELEFHEYVDNMFEQCLNMKMNTVIVQVRPFGDALYESSYFPWSSYISGEQGVSPSFDPLEYMIEAAHSRGLDFYAWVNPYRVAAANVTDIKTLSSNNQARIWRESSSTDKKRNVLTYNKQMYYNPAKAEVRTLIVNGIREIVKNYDVEGIIFDDYFYPSLGSSYKTIFDYAEYKSYKSECESKGTTQKSIETWRRNNVNILLKRVQSAIKSIDDTVKFGISPQGNLNNLRANDKNYCDIDTWMSSTSYIDFISPQIYWSFTNSAAPFADMLDSWIQARTNEKVSIFVSLSAYKAGLSKAEASALSPADLEWYSSRNVLKRQVEYGRETGVVDGYMYFRFDNMVSSKASKEINNLVNILP